MENKYIKEIERWDWQKIASDMKSYTHLDDCNDLRCRIFLGEGTSILPSKKFYAPFACSNVTEKEAEQDEEFCEALEEAAAKHGLYVFWEDGALFAGVEVDLEDIDESYSFIEESDRERYLEMMNEG